MLTFYTSCLISIKPSRSCIFLVSLQEAETLYLPMVTQLISDGARI
jgi:hypothetical protein